MGRSSSISCRAEGQLVPHLQRGKVVEKHREIQRDLHMMFIDLHKPLKARGRVSAIGSLEVFEGPGCT